MRKNLIRGSISLTFLMLGTFQAKAEGFNGLRADMHIGADRASGGELDIVLKSTSWGFGLGYDKELSEQFVVGLETNLDYFTGEYSGNFRIYGQNFPYSIKAKRDLEASLRFGPKLGTKGLLYGKAGYTNASYESSLTNIASVWQSGDGIRLGVGLEYAFHAHGFIKTEYRFSTYDSGNVTRSQIFTGVGYRF